MGITIHYNGKLKSPDLIGKICADLKEMAQSMGWEYTILDSDFNKPNTAKLEVKKDFAEITGHIPLQGIQLNIHKDCTSFSLLFDADGILREIIQMVEPEKGKEDFSHFIAIKTQYAPIDVHITIIKLLKYLKEKYFQNLEVTDEGEYWETEDKGLLFRKMEFLSNKIDAVAETLSGIDKNEFKNCDSDQAWVAKFEEIIKDKFSECQVKSYSKTTKTKYIH